jgi:signal transduction histidine kinase/DNA-binding response OmpR family regulator
MSRIAKSEGEPRDRASILLVDDRPDKHVVYRSILEDLGQNLVSARSGEEALREVLKNEFAVILLDVNMPGMDGLETAAMIRGRKRSAHVPIIFITADYGDEVRTARGYSLGAVDFMVSPIVPEVLRTKVKVFVDLYLLAQLAKHQARERGQLAAERTARAAAERASEASAFLARASVALSGSLNLGATTRELARLVVPFLADVGVLTIAATEDFDAKGEVVWAGDGVGDFPDIEAYAGIDCRWWRDVIERVIATGKREISAPADVSGALSDAGRPASAGGFEIPRNAKIESLAILPMIARGRTVGVLSLGLGSSRRSYDAQLLSIAADLADRGAIAMDNALLYKEMRDQDRRKNEFLAMLSHELRNPLAPITNAVHVLGTGDASKVEWARDVLDRQVKQLCRLVDDLLDVSRITHGKIELRLEAVDVAEVMGVAVETVRPFIDARSHTLSVSTPSQPVRVRGDFARLAQVLANLLNNAAKYTEDGGRISLSADREGNEIAFRVQDSGMGIPKEALGSIFEPFRQLGQAVDRPQGGLGVGLTLVKRLVDKHGGAVEVRSEGHQTGSEFVVRLPLLVDVAAGAPAELHVADAVRATRPRRRRRILVADDNVDLATSMGLLLELMGNEVRVTHDGMAAVAADAEFRPDVVFLDIGMGKLNGLDACRHIRRKPWGKEPIIVALTGWGQAEDKKRSREAGFDHHLVKPIEPAVLQRFLAEIEPQTA